MEPTVKLLGMNGAGLDVMLALAAVFLGLSLVVQVLQEIYNLATSSKARTYQNALRDLLGDRVNDLLGQGSGEGLRSRGPFQPWFSRVLFGLLPEHLRPQRRAPSELRPLDQKGLQLALEQTADPCVAETGKALRLEVKLQKGKQDVPSPVLKQLIENLWETSERNRAAREIFDYLVLWNVAELPDPKEVVRMKLFDAAAVHEGFSQRFLPEQRAVEEQYDQFAANFTHAYRRRNLRLTVILGFLLALGLDLGFRTLYERAARLSPEETTQLAETVLAVQRICPDDVSGTGSDQAATTAGEETTTSDETAPPSAGVTPTEGTPAETTSSPSAGDTSASLPSEPHGGDDEPEGKAPDPCAEVDSSAALEKLWSALELTKPPSGDDAFYGRGWKRLREIWEGESSAAGAQETERERPQADGTAARPSLSRTTRMAVHLVDCLITALLIAFGAPFWHRLSRLLLRVRQPTAEPAPSSGEPE